MRAALLAILLTGIGPVVWADDRAERPLFFRPLPFVARAQTIAEAREIPVRELDLGYVALLIGKRANPKLDVEGELGRLDKMARSVLRRLGGSTPTVTPRRAIAAIAAEIKARRIVARSGFGGGEPGNAYLDQVLSRRSGYCTALSALYIALGERIGLPLDLVELPDHVFVRYGEVPGHVNVETTAGGVEVPDATYRKRHRYTDRAAGYYLRNRDKRWAVAGLLLQHGLARWNAEDVEGAAEILVEALRWAPEHLATTYNLAGVQLRLGKYGSALARYKKYTALRPRDALGWFGQARAALRLGDLAAAEAALGRAARLDPRSKEIRQMKAELALARGDSQAALKALGKDNRSLEGRFLVARALIQRGQFAKAEVQLRAMMKDFPKVAEVPRQLAVVLKVQNRFDEAAAVLQKLLTTHPKMGSALVELGALREIQGRHAEAAALYERALALTDKHADLYLRTIRAMLEAGRNEDAVKTCSRGLDRHPEGIKARQLAKTGGDICRDRLGDRARATGFYRRYVALGGKDAEVIEYLEGKE